MRPPEPRRRHSLAPGVIDPTARARACPLVLGGSPALAHHPHTAACASPGSPPPRPQSGAGFGVPFARPPPCSLQQPNVRALPAGHGKPQFKIAPRVIVVVAIEIRSIVRGPDPADPGLGSRRADARERMVGGKERFYPRRSHRASRYRRRALRDVP